MTAVADCSTCAWLRRVIRREVRKQENRLRSGRIVDVTAIDRAKADLALCAAAGHHNPQAGADSRWHREPVTSHP